MAVEIIDGMEHAYAPNPKMQGEDWASEYPPIVTTSQWLINKYTGQVFPNTPEFARRSDILEPYLGEINSGYAPDTTIAEVVDVVTAEADTTDEKELVAL